MAPKKSRKNKPAPRRKTGARKNIGVRSNGSGLDTAAMGHARMLVDPCNAPMVPSTYSGMGTGQYRRVRSVFTIPATAVEGSYQFTPGCNIMLLGSNTAGTAGNSYGMTASGLFSSTDIPFSTDSRCIAACVKVRYIGSEQNRSGVIATRTSPFGYLVDGQFTDVANQIRESQVVNRTGEVLHEVKFVPGAGDELFTPNAGTSIPTQRTLGSFGVSYSTVQPGSLQFEITAILEIETGASTLSGVVAPASKNTVNHVLQALGAPINWAYNHLVAPTIKSVASAAMQTSIGGSTASSIAMRLLTL